MACMARPAQMSREALMKDYQALCFTLIDLNLYLDTHPMDENALAYFDKIRNMKKQVADEYTCLYGPLVPDDVNVEHCWTWVETPWPWERQV
jgi:spore coat protein JB